MSFGIRLEMRWERACSEALSIIIPSANSGQYVVLGYQIVIVNFAVSYRQLCTPERLAMQYCNPSHPWTSHTLPCHTRHRARTSHNPLFTPIYPDAPASSTQPACSFPQSHRQGTPRRESHTPVSPQISPMHHPPLPYLPCALTL